MTKKGHRRSGIRHVYIAALALAILVSGAHFFYQSRAIPDLVEQKHEVTTLPPDVSNVLAATTNSFRAEIPLRIPIFLYHYVEYVHDDPERAKLTTPPNVLVAEIETLKKAGYTFITPNDIADAFRLGKRLPLRSVILSFDDGYMDFYTDVFPILEKEQVKAVAYVVPNFLDRPNYMYTWELREIAKSPLVEIGAHTMDHTWLAGMNQKNATYEIAESRKTLQKLLGLPINSFAYPYGSFDLPTIQIVKDAGFTTAASTVPGIVHTRDTEYFLYRLRPGGRTGQELLNFLQQETFKPW